MLPLLLTLVVSAWAQCPSGYSYNSNFDKCYKFATSVSATYGTAQKACEDDDGTLASIGSAFENSLIQTFVGMTSAPAYFVGLNKLKGSWAWDDHSALNYTNWAAEEPSDYNCGAFNTHTGTWRTTDCNSQLPYVCSLVPNQQQCNCPTCPGPKIVCDEGWTYFHKTNSCYRTLYKGTFTDAEQTCQASGAHLASIHSDEENNFFYGTFVFFVANFSFFEISRAGATSQSQIGDFYAWFGMYRSNGHWVYTDGTATDYFKWAPTQPDNSEGHEFCVHMYTDPWVRCASSRCPETYWNDCDCGTVERAFVCKKPANV